MTSILMLAVLFAPPAPCGSLSALQLPHTTITAAQIVDRGAFVAPVPAGSDSAGTPASFKDLPAFCRVTGVLAPASDSHIEFEVWLPTSGWNGNYLGVGNGGQAGYINYGGRAFTNAPALADAVRLAFAASSTDTGHKGTNKAPPGTKITRKR